MLAKLTIAWETVFHHQSRKTSQQSLLVQVHWILPISSPEGTKTLENKWKKNFKQMYLPLEIFSSQTHRPRFPNGGLASLSPIVALDFVETTCRSLNQPPAINWTFRTDQRKYMTYSKQPYFLQSPGQDFSRFCEAKWQSRYCRSPAGWCFLEIQPNNYCLCCTYWTKKNMYKSWGVNFNNES